MESCQELFLVWTFGTILLILKTDFYLVIDKIVTQLNRELDTSY